MKVKKVEPLKGKLQTWVKEKNLAGIEQTHLLYYRDDVAGAVAWLKEELEDSITLLKKEEVEEKINEAFADVVEKEEKDASNDM